ncbi:hypothetical protein [Arthrobacter crystallopoietes]|uniref:hypothetical protein n=1 Tax=Crystallibacter crystallopoietes TaxID=37928 RepID=UPI0009452560|nr:hypothetical protein [Arthrobacter crystallopoietes]AUI51975.1 hypothetical protein AC20117_15460 [Arthrobacter crystallopoietes]
MCTTWQNWEYAQTGRDRRSFISGATAATAAGAAGGVGKAVGAIAGGLIIAAMSNGVQLMDVD